MNTKANKNDIKIEHEPLIESDKEKQLLMLGKLGLKSLDEGHPLEAFIYFSQLIESVMLPVLTYRIMKKLKIKSYFKQFSKLSFANKNIFYLALTQDKELFILLENFRRQRNSIIHDIALLDDIKIIESRASQGFRDYVNLFEEIDDRELGKKQVPVLTYYVKGYNQRGKDARERLEKMVSQ